MADPVLDVRGLVTRFGPLEGGVTAVDGVSFTLHRGRTTGLVGESGSGKSATALSIMRLVEPSGRTVAGAIRYNGRDLLALNEAAMRSIRGARIGMVFQDPLTSLNPALRVGAQIAETIRAHEEVSEQEAWARAIDLLARVGVAAPDERARDYPHQFSGGMRQRVMIAAAIACSPEIIIADEPTTALDVTVQAKILRLLYELQQEMGAALLLITHDLGVVAAMADEVLVMYAGRVVERADVDTLFHAPRHPYTQALLACVLDIEDDGRSPLAPIAGQPPDLHHPPPGCRFSPRCPRAVASCRRQDPQLLPVSDRQAAACLLEQRGSVHA
jgi:oligopeptide/dipeptide ABC transporter ATP-binding protein